MSPAAAPVHENISPRINTPVATRQRQSIVVVTSSPLLCRFLRLALEPEGYTVAEACSVKHAVGLASFTKAPLVIVDQDFGGTGWLGICRQLRVGLSGLQRRIIILTSPKVSADPDSLRALADSSLAKPCTVDVLRRRIREQLLIAAPVSARSALRH